MSLLDVQDLRVRFETADGTLEAVRGVNLDVNEGETFGIVGESGSGKSVTTQAVLGLLRGATVTGRAEFEGRDLLTMPPRELRRIRGSRIGMVFQDPLSSLHPHFRVGSQIAEAISAHERISSSAARRRAIELLAMVGLGQPDRRVEEYPHQFSGGMRQRVMVAMAVALRPALVIADEPTTALDVTVQAQILELLKDLARDHGTAVVLITHDLGVVADVADRVATMYAGTVVETGTRLDMYYQPHHPYTRGLLDSIPGDTPAGRRLQAIKGQPPSLLGHPHGCMFRMRCPSAMPECEQDPPARNVTSAHVSMCWLPVKAASEPRAVPQRSPRAARGSLWDEDCAADVLLRLTRVSKVFRRRGGWLSRHSEEVRAVEQVSLAVRRGETLGIVGESGCGKSTLARLITGLLPTTSGKVELGGEDITNLSEKVMRPYRRDVQMIFQDPYGSLNPRRRVGAIIADPFVIHGTDGTISLKDRVKELMELVGLNPEHYNRFPSEFSGGQRQRIGIARALATRPKLLVCDEPVSALDVSIQAQIVNLLQDLQSELGLTYIFIGHDLSVIKHIADRTAVMYLGSVVEIGETRQVFSDPRHPYTQALLSAAPIADPNRSDGRRRILLSGEVPSPINPPSGCRFHPRCPRAQQACAQTSPELERADVLHEGGEVACFFPINAVAGREVGRGA